MAKKRNFGELEASILNIVANKPGSAVSDVVAALGSSDSYTAVMTVMNRLVIKREMSRRLEGKRYVYMAKAQNPLIKRFKAKFFDGKAMTAIAHLLSEEDLSSQDLDEIERMIQKKRKGK